jgi:hypothetical protein
MRYEYATDPYPNKQDAMKILVREGTKGPNCHVRIPLVHSMGKNVMIALDYWLDPNFRFSHSKINGFKECPFAVFSGGERSLVDMRVDFPMGEKHPHNQPPGGPFVTMVFAHVLGKSPVIRLPQYGGHNWMDSMTGFERARLPYGADQIRNYAEAMQPFDTSVVPGGMELGIVGARKTRFYWYFERDATLDWVSQSESLFGKTMSAYKWSVWMADTERDPLRQIDEAGVGIPTEDTRQIASMRLQMGSGEANEASMYAGRGDLVAYASNIVVLHGISKAEVESLLAKPVD